MRRELKVYSHGDTRTVTKFLWVPMTARMGQRETSPLLRDPRPCVRKWLEKATWVEELQVTNWVVPRWVTLHWIEDSETAK